MGQFKIKSNMKVIKTFEAFKGDWDSSIEEKNAKSYNLLLNEMREKIDSIKDESKFSEMEKECDKRLDVYDNEVKEFIIDNIFYNNVEDSVDDIIKLGDLIMSKYGTEPQQVLNAIDDCYSTILKF